MTKKNGEHIQGWILLFIVSLHAMVPGALSSAQDSDDFEALRDFQNLCRTTERQPAVQVTFAPVRRLAEKEDPLEGTWRYAYERSDTSDRGYRNNRYSLNAGNGRIYLVSTLRPPSQGTELPPFLWHVISVPTENPDGVGFIARHDTLYARESSDDGLTRERYTNLMRSTVTTNEGRLLFYVDPKLLDRGQETALHMVTEAWNNTFRNTMSALRMTRRSGQRIYTHTFIYVDAPGKVDDIHRDTGDRRVSSKIVHSSGTAFGFVLDARGECLASTTLSLEP